MKALIVATNEHYGHLETAAPFDERPLATAGVPLAALAAARTHVPAPASVVRP